MTTEWERSFRPQKCADCIGNSACVTSRGSLKSWQNFSVAVWLALHNAASVRQDATYEFLRKENVAAEDEPRGVYHRSYYQNFTNKTNLTSLQKKREKFQDETNNTMWFKECYLCNHLCMTSVPNNMSAKRERLSDRGWLGIEINYKIRNTATRR
jgi:hypothetical protein